MEVIQVPCIGVKLNRNRLEQNARTLQCGNKEVT